MKSLKVLLLPLIAALCIHPGIAQQKGALTLQTIERLEKAVPVNAQLTAMMNAVTANDVKTIALSREQSIATDHYFSNTIETQGITDQQKSGRCWLFAGLNILRPAASKNLKVKKFEFSQTYLFFYDKLEKANLFLESIIETRQRPLDDRDVNWLLGHPMMDGGQWSMALELIEKYGVVPADVMPETQSSANTDRLNSMLGTLLCKQASVLRSMAEKGATEDALRAEKEKMLVDDYKMIVVHFGVPPKSFVWRYEDAEGKVTEPKTYTPKQFYKEFVNIDLRDYVCLHSVPVHAYNKAYQVKFDRNLYDMPNMTFVNVPLDKMKEYTLKSVLGNDPVWFGCDVGKESDSKLGVMKRGLYDYKSIYSIDLDMNKADRIRYQQTVPSHAMVFTGVDVAGGKPVKWQVENSWGTKAGDNGFFVMYDDWFDEYMFSVIVHKKYLPADVVKLAAAPDAEVLPPWDPLFSVEPR